MSTFGLSYKLNALLECAVDQLEDIAQPVPERSFIAPGDQVAWEMAGDNDCNEALWVRVVRSWPSDSFPDKTLDITNCNRTLAIQIGLGIIRCQTGVDQFPISAEDLTQDGYRMVCDQGALFRAITCCWDEATEGAVAVDTWTPRGPQGGMFGGEWTAWIEADLDCALDVTSP